ncbi:hypothetical protein FRX31_024119 [Thalictrum thalictroides]|uniref:RNase H type-1 domain-containing protein n=1 Tax=Thalictrum thalictroides TaxID=46969 RepID=A0A7J6VN05_THATH|nr:hypothetical protein FRX31_024119 [Thalictrum thalictroides]
MEPSFLLAGTESGNVGISSEHAECKGSEYYKQLHGGKEQGIKCIEVETDFKGVVDYLAGRATNLSLVATMFWIKWHFYFLTLMIFICCNRNGNVAANLLAKNAYLVF